MSTLPRIARSLFDDAAVFPPGSAALADAVPAHLLHTTAAHAEAVGPLVLPASALGELPPLLGPEGIDLSVTLPSGPERLAEVAEAVAAMPIRLRALEIAVAEWTPTGFFTALGHAWAAAAGKLPPGIDVFVEIPRDQRREEVLSGCRTGGWRAKFRTGGIEARLYPGEEELATAIRAAVDAEVPFKATAGLHHAVRNTDPRTGFEQHGFLNLLLATDAAVQHGAGTDELRAVLAERDSAMVARRVAELDDDRAGVVRERFVSFGTCSILEPLSELVALGLAPEHMLEGEGAIS